MCGVALTRNHNELGEIDLKAIQSQIKDGMQNVLFCHHALTHRLEEDKHLCVMDGEKISAELRNMGIETSSKHFAVSCSLRKRLYNVVCSNLRKTQMS